MPAIQITLNDICFDPEVQTYCNNPKFKCPNYNRSWACPPVAPYLEDKVSQYQRFYLIYFEFNLKKHVEKIKINHPEKNEESIRNTVFRKELDRNSLENEILNFIKHYKESYDDSLILWEGYCRICFKEGKSCTYESKDTCRYPDRIRYSMEAVGINVDITVKNLNIPLEWPPINYAYRFGLVCLK